MVADVLKLLVVEDDNSQYEAYEDAVEEFNENTDPVRITLERKLDAPSAIGALLSGGYDGGIVDLNLDPNNASEASGNQVLLEIMGKHRFPIFVVSGGLGVLDEGIRSKESLFLKLYSRETPNDEILGEFIKIYNTGVTKILRGDGELERQLGMIFWEHFSQDLDVWFDQEKSNESSLLRYTLNHLTEYLDAGTETGRFYNDAEFYIKPPIREHLATGDLSKLDNSFFLLLSPACDIAVRDVRDDGVPIVNTGNVMLAELVLVNRDDFLSNGLIKEEDSKKSIKSTLDKIIKSQKERFVFLPDYKDIPASVVDFRKVQTLDYCEYVKNYDRVATVAGPFLKEIQARFSSYVGRPGTPDLDSKELLNKHQSVLAPTS